MESSEFPPAGVNENGGVLQTGNRTDSAIDEIPNEQPEGPFSIGSVLGLTFKTILTNPLPCLVFAFLSAVLAAYLDIFLPGRSVKVVEEFLELFLSLLFSGAIAYCVYQSITGKKAGIDESFRRGLSRYPALFGLGLIYLVGGLLLAFLFVVIARSVFLVFIAFAVLVYITTVIAVAVPACVVEGVGPINSIDRSDILTKNHRWSICGLCVLLLAAKLAVNAVVSFLRLPVIAGFDVGGVFTGFLFTLLEQVGITALYFELRAAKEGVRVENLAKVFE